MVATTLAPAREVPGPYGRSRADRVWTQIRILRSFQTDPQRLFLELQREFGDVVRFGPNPYAVYLVTHPDGVKHVLLDNHRNYTRGRWYKPFEPVFGRGLLTTDGEVWRKHRRIVQPFFHRKDLEAAVPILTDAVARTLDHWEADFPRGAVFDVVPEMLTLTLRMLGNVIFSWDLGEEAHIVEPATRHAISIIVRAGKLREMIPLWVPTPHNREVQAALGVLHATMDRVIEAHRRRPPARTDIVTALLSARDEETGEALSEAEVHDEAMTIFLAGFETSGTALSWMLYELSMNPDVRRKVEEEVDLVLGTRAPTAEDLQRMTYSRAVVDETLRLHPAIWVYPRDSIAADEICGYRIPAGSSINLSSYVTHRHPAFWENPEGFDPGRFTPEGSKDRPRFAYFPFGGGQRQCLGMHMALLEMQVTIAMLAQRFRLNALPGHRVECRAAVSLRPTHGILMRIHPRGG